MSASGGHPVREELAAAAAVVTGLTAAAREGCLDAAAALASLAAARAETRAWHVLVSGRKAGLVRPTWRGERSRPGWEGIDNTSAAVPVTGTGTGRVKPAGNASTRDAAAVSLLTALLRQQGKHAASAH
jgi:hypothetical protein